MWQINKSIVSLSLGYLWSIFILSSSYLQSIYSDLDDICGDNLGGDGRVCAGSVMTVVVQEPRHDGRVGGWCYVGTVVVQEPPDRCAAAVLG